MLWKVTRTQLIHPHTLDYSTLTKRKLHTLFTLALHPSVLSFRERPKLICAYFSVRDKILPFTKLNYFVSLFCINGFCVLNVDPNLWFSGVTELVATEGREFNNILFWNKYRNLSFRSDMINLTLFVQDKWPRTTVFKSLISFNTGMY